LSSPFLSSVEVVPPAVPVLVAVAALAVELPVAVALTLAEPLAETDELAPPVAEVVAEAAPDVVVALADAETSGEAMVVVWETDRMVLAPLAAPGRPGMVAVTAMTEPDAPALDAPALAAANAAASAGVS
jgi:hypothetical protein